jgi:hypothetical protein
MKQNAKIRFYFLFGKDDAISGWDCESDWAMETGGFSIA